MKSNTDQQTSIIDKDFYNDIVEKSESIWMSSIKTRIIKAVENSYTSINAELNQRQKKILIDAGFTVIPSVWCKKQNEIKWG